VVEPVAEPHAKDVEVGGGPVKPIAAAVVLFGMWTCAVLLLPALVGGHRGRRAAQPA